MPVGAVASASASAAAGGVTAGAGARAGGAVQAAAVAAGVGDGAGGGDASARHVSELERRDLPQPAVKVRAHVCVCARMGELEMGASGGTGWDTLEEREGAIACGYCSACGFVASGCVGVGARVVVGVVVEGEVEEGAWFAPSPHVSYVSLGPGSGHWATYVRVLY